MPQENALEAAVDSLISGHITKITTFGLDEFLKTGVDPFRFTINVSIWGLKEAVRKEIEHKVEMSLENLVGDFHENYLGNVAHVPTGKKWSQIPEGKLPGVDIANRELDIYLQIKSKHNSMNSSSSKNLAKELGGLKAQEPQAIVGCAWVVATQKKRAIGENAISDIGGLCLMGNKSYEYVTGEPGEVGKVLEKMLELIPSKIEKVKFSALLDAAAGRVVTDLAKRAHEMQMTPVQLIARVSID